MSIVIRKAQIDDSRDLTILSQQLGYESSIDDIERRLAEILDSDGHQVYVACNNELVLGWIHGFYAIKIESPPFVEIGGLVVADGVRGQGVGKQLVQSVMQWTQSIGCARLRVRCNAVRLASHDFYGALGFELNKQQKVFDLNLHP